jgi:hypothetical protein
MSYQPRPGQMKINVNSSGLVDAVSSWFMTESEIGKATLGTSARTRSTLRTPAMHEGQELTMSHKQGKIVIEVAGTDNSWSSAPSYLVRDNDRA